MIDKSSLLKSQDSLYLEFRWAIPQNVTIVTYGTFNWLVQPIKRRSVPRIPEGPNECIIFYSNIINKVNLLSRTPGALIVVIV